MALPIEELIGFLSVATRMDVRAQALEYVKGLTAGEDKALFRTHAALVAGMAAMACDESAMPVVRNDAYVGLTNLAVDKDFAVQIMHAGILPAAVAFITLPDNDFADSAAMLLGNMTRVEAVADELLSLSVRGAAVRRGDGQTGVCLTHPPAL
jgi:hypothetical protein